MVYRREFVEALVLLADAFERVVASGHARPVLVGGAAVEFYTGGAVVSGDFDVVTDAQGALESALIDLGFKREDRPQHLLRGLYHPDLEIGVEVVSGRLFDGASDETRVRLVDVRPGQRVAIAPPEDLIADRMGQYCSIPNRIPEMLDQAVKLYQLAGEVDDAYLEKRIREETQGECGIENLRSAIR
jgi:hypothetical protein